MPKALARKRAEEYESDDGFIADAPTAKKSKREPKELNASGQVDDEGNHFWELSGKRRVQITEFKNNTFVNIREFYEKDGKALPGKKGIAMSTEQYNALVTLLPQIETALKKKGIEVSRPEYANHGGGDHESQNENDDNSDEDDEQKEALAPPKRQIKPAKSRTKKNHDATSDEDEDEDEDND